MPSQAAGTRVAASSASPGGRPNASMCSSSRTVAEVPSVGQNGGMSLPSITETPAARARRYDCSCSGAAPRERSCIQAGTPSESKKSLHLVTDSVGTRETPRSDICWATASVSWYPCSTQSRPCSTAGPMMRAGPACAVTLRPQACAVKITADSSSGASGTVSMVSCSPAIPPEIMTLMRSAPALICARVPRTNPSGPSHSSVFDDSCPCPPVHTSARPAVRMRGPSVRPAAMAERSAKSTWSISPTQRTVVTPHSRVRRAPSPT